jgi:hypothetical protein
MDDARNKHSFSLVSGSAFNISGVWLSTLLLNASGRPHGISKAQSRRFGRNLLAFSHDIEMFDVPR